MNSGVYTVRVNDSDIEVYCDMTTAAGGWLVSLIEYCILFMAIYFVPRRIRKLGPNLGLKKLQAAPQAFSRKKCKDKICWCSVTS